MDLARSLPDNTSYDDICEARVTFMQQGRRDAVCIELLLAGKSLHVTQRGATPDAAVDAAFRVLQRQLRDVRAARRARTSIGVDRRLGGLLADCRRGGRTPRIPGLGWAAIASTHHLCEGKHVWRRNVRFMW